MSEKPQDSWVSFAQNSQTDVQIDEIAPGKVSQDFIEWKNGNK